MPFNYGTYCVNKNFSISEHTILIWRKYDKLPSKEKLYCSIDEIVKYDQKGYIIPLIELFNSDNYFNEYSFLIRPGDVFFNFDVPIITKTRPIDNSYNVLINLDSVRHWDELETIKKHDIDFKDKNNKIIWRGAMNGFWFETFSGIKKIKRARRRILCEKYWNSPNVLIDVGFINHLMIDVIILIDGGMIKQKIIIEEQLKSKFLISVEGGGM